MKSLATLIQIAALAACVAVQFHPANVTGMPGTHEALRTLVTFTAQPSAAAVAMHNPN